MKYSLEFTIPELPLPMNRVLRLHWAKRTRYFDSWYMAVAAKVGKLKPKRPLELATLTLTRYTPLRYFADFDGCVASFKPVVDGLTHAGVLDDDAWDVTGPWIVDQRECAKGLQMIHVKVESRDE